MQMQPPMNLTQDDLDQHIFVDTVRPSITLIKTIVCNYQKYIQDCHQMLLHLEFHLCRQIEANGIA